jgi:hypothetical protein
MALVLAATASTGAGPAEAPPTPSVRPPSGIVERVEVREVQVFVTAWPKDGDVARCATLTREDLALDVDGVPTPILSLLPWDETAVEVPVEPSPATPPAEYAPASAPRLSLVVLIDEFHHSCPACAARMSCCEGSSATGGAPILRHDAYETARQMLRESFRAGDRVLIATLAFWPQAETGWLDDPAAALARLDELEQGKRWVTWEQSAAHVDNWYPGMISFFRALGQLDGPKEVIFPTCHFQLDATSGEEIRELGTVAQQNDVVLHTIDLMNCSLTPICPPPQRCCSYDFVGPLAANLGGRRFSKGQGATGAVNELRRVAGCRFLLSFKPKVGRRGRLGHSISLSTRRSAEFDLRAPTTFPDPGRRATGQQTREAMFLMSELGQGYLADVGIWPLRRANGREWDALAIVRIERPPGAAPVELPDELVIDVVAWREGHRAASREVRLRGEQLSPLADGAGGKTLAVPLRVSPGENNLSVIVDDPASKEGAVRHRRVTIPDLGTAERGGWWMVSGREARLEGVVVPTPTGRTTFRVGETPRLLGLECGEPRASAAAEARCTDETSASSVPARARLLVTSSRRIAPPAGCRWLVVEPLEPLPPGRWTCAEGAPVIEVVDPGL